MKTRRRRYPTPRTKFPVSSIILTLILFLLTLFFIFSVNPATPGAIPVFLIIFFLTLFLTFSLIFRRPRRGLLTSSVIIIFLILRLFDVGNLLNLLLLSGIAFTLEIFFSSHS